MRALGLLAFAFALPPGAALVGTPSLAGRRARAPLARRAGGTAAARDAGAAPAGLEAIRVNEVAAGACPAGVDFNSLGLLRATRHSRMRDNLKRMGVLGPNMVQAQCAPLLLDGRDLVLHASTGSGKTLSFVLPALSTLVDDGATAQLLILCPSKELALQIDRCCTMLVEGTGLCSLALVGGVNVARQEEKLRKTHPQLIIATPRRLAELALGKIKKLKLSSIRAIIVDEVDEVLRPPHRVDFLEAVRHTRRSVEDAHPGLRVQLIFASATGDSPAVREAALTMMHKPALLTVQREQDAKGLPPTIEHGLLRVPNQKRIESLKRILSMQPRPQVLAFVNSAEEADYVSEKLNELGVLDVMPVRSSQERDERVTAMQRLMSGKLRAIVCTDIAARGLDVPTLTMVVNMDPPEDGRRYVHRAGRCGRAGREGAVISIVSTDAQETAVRALAAKLKVNMRPADAFGGALVWDEAALEMRKEQKPPADSWTARRLVRRAARAEADAEGDAARDTAAAAAPAPADRPQPPPRPSAAPAPGPAAPVWPAAADRPPPPPSRPSATPATGSAAPVWAADRPRAPAPSAGPTIWRSDPKPTAQGPPCKPKVKAAASKPRRP